MSDTNDDSLRTLGEFGLIDRVTRVLQAPGCTVVGIGDDCAVLQVGDRVLMATCDASIEEVHFSRVYATAEDIGWKAAATALSDIAAMGGRPLFLLTTLACPADASADFVEGLYRGMQAATGQAGGGIVGGDTTRSNQGYLIDVTVIGEPVGTRYLLRDGARDGDLLAVTGWPGRSSAGLLALQLGVDAPELAAAHLRPVPRIVEGQWLAAQPGAHALIDVSDGLLQDAGHLAERSKVGVDVSPDLLPMAEALTEAAARLGPSAESFILAGGEDYELAVALDPSTAAKLCQAFEREFGLPLTIVGRFSADWSGVRLAGEPIAQGGFEHFR
jgi:thiamine-monophosphate kinase